MDKIPCFATAQWLQNELYILFLTLKRNDNALSLLVNCQLLDISESFTIKFQGLQCGVKNLKLEKFTVLSCAIRFPVSSGPQIP